MLRVISLFSLFSQFAALYDPAGPPVKKQHFCLGSGCFFRPFLHLFFPALFPRASLRFVGTR